MSSQVSAYNFLTYFYFFYCHMYQKGSPSSYGSVGCSIRASALKNLVSKIPLLFTYLTKYWDLSYPTTVPTVLNCEIYTLAPFKNSLVPDSGTYFLVFSIMRTRF